MTVSSHELYEMNMSTIDIEILWLIFDHPRMKKICLFTDHQRVILKISVIN